MDYKSNKINTDDPRSSKQSRAKRLETLRGMTRLSREKFALKCGIKPGNLQNWEGPRFGGLTVKGGKKIINGLKIFGIHCSLEWLMYGVGSGPYVTDVLFLDQHYALEESSKPYLTHDEEISLITEELLLFRQHYPDTLDHIITDDSMEPYFKMGDYVAGKCRHHEHINTLMGLTCIVKTTEGEIMVRQLQKGNQDDRYTLACTNTQTINPSLQDIEIISAAPIIWIRRKDPSIS